MVLDIRKNRFFRLGFLPSPNNPPQAFKLSILSKIIFIIAKAGMHKNIPEIPQSCSPISLTPPYMKTSPIRHIVTLHMTRQV